MLALFGKLVTIPLYTATVIGPVAAASEIMLRHRELPGVERLSQERIAEAQEPKRRPDSQFRHKRIGTPSRAMQAKPEDCNPEDRRCEVQRKLGGTVDDRRTPPRKGRTLPSPDYYRYGF
jgi:hypothetical protein